MENRHYSIFLFLLRSNYFLIHGLKTKSSFVYYLYLSVFYEQL